MTERVENTLSRRKVFAGVGAAGALAAVATALPMVKPDRSAAVAAEALERRQGDGYQVTDHVKQYYQTARA
ncbi:MAG: formate dehydrogenase [Ideonella sp.]